LPDPSLLVGILLFYYLGVQLYYLTERLEARIRQLRADAAYSEAQAAHRAAQVSDLTATAQGKILPRLVQDEATGRLLLVDPDLGTRPVLDVDPDTLPEDDPRLRALALINKLSATTAPAEAGGDKTGAGRGGPALNDVLAAALVLTGGLQNMDERLPPHIRVLSADETEALPDNE
jgi:hypothetical protein